jgi:hypothetical protein
MLTLSSQQRIVDFLKSRRLEVEIFSEFPTDETNVRHGVYVSNPMITNFEPDTRAFCNDVMGSVIENITVLVVSFQDDKRLSAVSDAVTDIPFSELNDGFIDVVFDVTRNYQNRAEYRTYNFAFKRHKS